MADPTLLIKEISDLFLRQNFEKLQAYFAAQNQLLNFKFYEANLAAGANQLIAHGQSIAPLDIILTHLTGPGTITFNYGLFDSTNMNVTATDAVRVRFFAGTYYALQSSTALKTTDAQVFHSV